MSEWQPARLFDAHDLSLGCKAVGIQIMSSEEILELTRRTFHVRPIEFGEVLDRTVAAYRYSGCDSEKFYFIQEIDKMCCEHEILTD